MCNPFDTGSPTVDRMCRLQFTGNVIPSSWYHTIKKETGKPNLNAIIILADIVYWYRPVEIRDEATGQLCGFKKKFQADILQRNYQQIAELFGISKRDATNAIVELEKVGVVRRVFRTVSIKGQLYSNVMFLDLDVDELIQLTYPDTLDLEPEKEVCRGYHSFEEQGAPKKGTGVTKIRERVSQKWERPVTEMRETYTKNTYRDYNKEFPLQSYQETEEQVKEQIDYSILKLDHMHDERIEELVGLIVDVLTSVAEKIRVNKEEKPAEVVKVQFRKLRKEHVEFVLLSMDSNTTKARNIRAVLITALYNAVNTMGSYYGNLVRYHMEEERRGEEP